jgi:hypothetical protein
VTRRPKDIFFEIRMLREGALGMAKMKEHNEEMDGVFEHRCTVPVYQAFIDHNGMQNLRCAV